MKLCNRMALRHAAIAKRVPLLPELEVLVLTHLPSDICAAPNALIAYLALRGCSGRDESLARIEITHLPYSCCALLTCQPWGVSDCFDCLELLVFAVGGKNFPCLLQRVLLVVTTGKRCLPFHLV